MRERRDLSMPAFPSFGPFERPLAIHSGGAKAKAEKEGCVSGNILGLLRIEGTNNLINDPPTAFFFVSGTKRPGGHLVRSFSPHAEPNNILRVFFPPKIPSVGEYLSHYIVTTGNTVSSTTGLVYQNYFFNISKIKADFGIGTFMASFYPTYFTSFGGEHTAAGHSVTSKFTVWSSPITAAKPGILGKFTCAFNGLIAQTPTGPCADVKVTAIGTNGDNIPDDLDSGPAWTISYGITTKRATIASP